MAKVILMCGRICSGKSTYAGKLRKELNAAVLSVDEIMLALFGQDAGEKHDEYYERLEKYLFDKSLELIKAGINVILDIGLWTKTGRKAAREFYASRGVEFEICYIRISAGEWKRRVEKRNKAVSEGKLSAYYIDEGLMKKADGIFEEPDDDEIDMFIADGGAF